MIRLQRTVGNRATVRLLYRLIYKDATAREEKRPYKDLTKVPWYANLKPHQQEIAMRLHKNQRRHLTTAEVDALLAAGGEIAEDDPGYSSGAEHETVAAEDRLLSPAEFTQLPDTGTINPLRLRTAQAGIERHFREKDKGTVTGLAQDMARDPRLANALPPVNIGVHQGRVWAFDTRRVVAGQMARAKNPAVVIRYRKIPEAEKEGRVGSIFSPRPWMGIVTAIRYGGLKSTSEPWVNPAYEPQLAGPVLEHWQQTAEGFPLDQPTLPAPSAEADVEEARETASAPSSEASSRSVPFGAPRSLSEETGRADAGLIRAELEQMQRNFRAWLEHNSRTRATEQEEEHARQVWDYVKKNIVAGVNKSAQNGFVLDDVFAVVTSLESRHHQVLYLNEWRIPAHPKLAPAPLLRRIRGG